MKWYLLIVIWLVVGFVMYKLVNQQNEVIRIEEPNAPEALTGDWKIEVTASYNSASDPFGLEKENDRAAIQIRVNGKLIESSTGPKSFEQGIPVLIDCPGLHESENSIYVETVGPSDSIGKKDAVRFRLLQNNKPEQDHTIWIDSSQTPSIELQFNTKKTQTQ